MAKKILSVVLAVIMLMSVLVVAGFAADSYEMKVKKLILGSGVNGGTALTDTKYNSYLALDPNIVEENLYFWDDEIVDAYHNATTAADWAALFDEMTNEDNWVQAYEGDDGYLIDYYPSHLCNGKAKTDVFYTADKEYAKPGDIITVTVSVTTNFFCRDCEVGIIFDKTLVDLVEDSADWVEMEGRRKVAVVPDFGIQSGVNRYDKLWPASMRENKNGEFDQYQLVKVATSYQVDNPAPNKYAVKFNKTPIMTAQFKVKSGVADGTALKFFAVDGVQPVISDFELQETWSATLFKTYRILSDYVSVKPIECSEYDQTYTFSNATVMVGEPGPDAADYTALDAAIAAFDDTNAADYTTATWNAYANAVTAGQALDRGLTEDEQTTVDNATAAITNAKAALAKNAVGSAAQEGAAVIGGNAKVNVVVDGQPSAIRLTGTSTLTYTRDDATITDNGNGTETWAINVVTSGTSATYDVTAKYANWTATGKSLTVMAAAGADLNVYSIVVSDMYPEDGNGGVVVKGKHKVVVRTGKDVYKIQFVDTTGKIEDGCTSTYCFEEGQALHMASVVEDGDQLVWTFDFAFGPLGDWSMPVRTRSTSTTFATVEGVSLDAYVVY